MTLIRLLKSSRVESRPQADKQTNKQHTTKTGTREYAYDTQRERDRRRFVCCCVMSSHPILSISPHATLLRPEPHGSTPIIPGSPLPHMYEGQMATRNAGAASNYLASPTGASSSGMPRSRSGVNLTSRDSFSSPTPTTNKKFKIYYCMEMASLAQQIVKLDERFILGEIHWDHFPDGRLQISQRTKKVNVATA